MADSRRQLRFTQETPDAFRLVLGEVGIHHLEREKRVEQLVSDKINGANGTFPQHPFDDVAVEAFARLEAAGRRNSPVSSRHHIAPLELSERS